VVFAQIPPLIKAIEPILAGISNVVGPQLLGILNDLAPVIGGLLNVMSAAAPAFGPFIEALERLVGGLLPGIATVIKATVPFIQQFAGILGGLGGSLGQLFATAAPAIGASMKILGGLLGLIGDLLPVVMQLAGIFATSLAPVFTVFAGVVQTLLGPLTMIGGVIAQFAGAVIGDLAGAFGAVATLITAIGPGLGILAKAFGSLFTVLENAGVFAVVGDALENLAPTIGKLIALIITDLAPILPVIIGLFSQMLTITVQLATSGLGVLLGVLLNLVTALPVGLIQALVGGFIALKLVMMGFEGVGAIFKGVAAATAALGAALDFDTIALKAMYAWDILVAAAQGAWNVVLAVTDALMNLSPLGLIVLGIAAVVAATVLLATHWSQVWGAVKQVASDVGGFLDNLFHNGIVQDILAIWSLGLVPLAEHWTTIWGDIQGVAKDAANFLAGLWGDVETVAKTVWGAISSFFSGWWAGEVAAWKADVATVESLFKAAWDAITTALKTAWNAIATFFTGWWNNEVNGWKTIIATVKALFAAAWTDVTGTLKAAWNAIAAFFTGWWNGEVTAFRNVGATIESVLAAAWNAMFATVKAVWGAVLAYIRGIPGQVTGALGPLGGDLKSLGSAVFGDMLAGIKAGASDIVSWLQGFAKDVISVFKTIWGWFSPSTVMYAGGKALMDGLAGGIKDHAHQAVAQATSAAGKVTAGVAQWKGLVLQALKMEGLSASLVGNVLYQMQTESGGNEAAINLTDINAQEGDPSRGLMQVIGTTFSEYHWPGTSGNIYDPLANIAAALNYARNVYGPTLMDGGMGIGSGHGYALGGPINEPIIGYGVNSGRRYTFGEAGPEYVTPGGGPPGSDPAMLARLDQLIAATRQIPAGVGNTVGGAIGGSAHAASFRSRYPRGGA
jgi:SLT domain-containing protein/phage-related protein